MLNIDNNTDGSNFQGNDMDCGILLSLDKVNILQWGDHIIVLVLTYVPIGLIVKHQLCIFQN